MLVDAIETVLKGGFTLEARSVIRVECRFAGFEMFFDYLGANRPGAGAESNPNKDMQTRFDRCRHNREGCTIVEYDATVWELVKT